MEAILGLLLPILSLAFPEAAPALAIAAKLLPYAPEAIAVIEEAVKLGESAFAALQKRHPEMADAISQITKNIYQNVTESHLDHTAQSIFAPHTLTQAEENKLADQLGDPPSIGTF